MTPSFEIIVHQLAILSEKVTLLKKIIDHQIITTNNSYHHGEKSMDDYLFLKNTTPIIATVQTVVILKRLDDVYEKYFRNIKRLENFSNKSE
jgi:hypothetical protein